MLLVALGLDLLSQSFTRGGEKRVCKLVVRVVRITDFEWRES